MFFSQNSDHNWRGICKLKTEKRLSTIEKWSAVVNREDAYSRTAYFIRHTALPRTYAIVAYVRHNNNADSPVFGIPALLPIEMNRLSSRWSSSKHGTSALTRVFDSKHMDVKTWSATWMFVLSKASIGLSTWLNEPRHCSTIIIQPLQARAACQQAIIAHGEGYCAKNKECMGVHDI